MGEDAESVTHRIGRLKAGDSVAASLLWQRYFDELVRIARLKLGRSPRVVADEEDVALGPFNSVYLRAARGRVPDLTARDDLWRLMVTLTVRKAINQGKHQRWGKRGGGRVLVEADWIGMSPGLGDAGLEWLAG